METTILLQLVDPEPGTTQVAFAEGLPGFKKSLQVIVARISSQGQEAEAVRPLLQTLFDFRADTGHPGRQSNRTFVYFATADSEAVVTAINAARRDCTGILALRLRRVDRDR